MRLGLACYNLSLRASRGWLNAATRLDPAMEASLGALGSAERVMRDELERVRAVPA